MSSLSPWVKILGRGFGLVLFKSLDSSPSLTNPCITLIRKGWCLWSFSDSSLKSVTMWRLFTAEQTVQFAGSAEVFCLQPAAHQSWHSEEETRETSLVRPKMEWKGDKFNYKLIIPNMKHWDFLSFLMAVAQKEAALQAGSWRECFQHILEIELKVVSNGRAHGNSISTRGTQAQLPFHEQQRDGNHHMWWN